MKNCRFLSIAAIASPKILYIFLLFIFKHFLIHFAMFFPQWVITNVIVNFLYL